MTSAATLAANLKAAKPRDTLMLSARM